MPLAWLDAGLPTIRWADAWAVLYVGLVTSGVAYLLFSMALRHISAASGVTLALFEPVVACLLAAAVLGESVRALAWAGLGLVLLGVILVMRAELPLAAGPICGTAGRRYRGPPTAEIETLASKDDWGIGMGATPRPKPRRAHDRAR